MPGLHQAQPRFQTGVTYQLVAASHPPEGRYYGPYAGEVAVLVRALPTGSHT